MSNRTSDSPHRIQQARRPAHISDDLEDKTVAALSGIAHGDRLHSRSRSRESSDSAGAVIDRLLAAERAPSHARASDQPTAATGTRHASGGTRPTGWDLGPPTSGGSPSQERGRGRAYGSRVAPQDSAHDANRAPESPAVVHARLRRTAVIPRVLTVPCVEHSAEAGAYCYEHPRGVCGRRVQTRAGKS